MAQSEPKEQVDILLVGKTGNGKSATGNSILRKTEFGERSSTDSVTQEVQFEFTEFEGKIIKVVDGPGVGDTKLDTEKGVKLVVDAMSKAVSLSPKGFHAILVIMQYGQRFTQEDVETIEILKNIFSKNLISHYSVLVLTHGDQFDPEDGGPTEFKEWCRQQGGNFARLFEECERRVLLIDNKTKDMERKNEQVSELLGIIERFSTSRNRYTDKVFQKAWETRAAIMKDPKRVLLGEEVLIDFALITQNSGRLSTLQLEEDKESRKNLEEKLDKLEKDVGEDYKGTKHHGVIIKTIGETKTLLRNLNSKLLENEEWTEDLRRTQAEIDSYNCRQEGDEDLRQMRNLHVDDELVEMRGARTKGRDLQPPGNTPEEETKRLEELQAEVERLKGLLEKSEKERKIEVSKIQKKLEEMYRTVKNEETRKSTSWIGSKLESCWCYFKQATGIGLKFLKG